MKKLFLICFLYCQLPVSLSQKKYFQQQVNYNIEVTLHDSDNTLNAFETINYTNNSPDTLNFIWFHLWPDAYKNDRTAFSEQMLILNKTDFYFSNESERGYINRLDFKVDGTTANLEDHLLYIDVAKLILPWPLPPGGAIKITTPFHEKIPFNFSRGGHVGHTYQITQWYPKPAVYDDKGWHPMPYLDQGEFYSEFGNFRVQITVPSDYVIAATGELQNEDELKWLKKKAMSNEQQPAVSHSHNAESKKPKAKSNEQQTQNTKNKKVKKRYQPTANKNNKPTVRPSSIMPEQTKTLTYIQDSIHDFAWFADKKFVVKYDTMQLTSGRIIDAWSFYMPSGQDQWKHSIQFIKNAIRTRSSWLGEYPYSTVTTVEAKMGFSGGMEYPTITSISPMPDKESLDLTIEHEVGHNWVYGILASNEREHPWMDEGINTYFDNRYEKLFYPNDKNQSTKGLFRKKFPNDFSSLIYRTQVNLKKDQPIETPSKDFTETNYDVIPYYKTGLWMEKLEDFVGKDLFDSCLHEYYNEWKFKHPYPEDFKKIVEDVGRKNVDTIFSLLSKKGNLEAPKKKEFKISTFFNFKNTDKYNYLFLSPALGYNNYDKQMFGIMIHNYTLPAEKFQFFVAPLYATGSKTFSGISGIDYHWFPDPHFQKIAIGINASKFSDNHSLDTAGNNVFENFHKIVPYLKIFFKTKPGDKTTTWLDFRSYIIGEKQFGNYSFKTGSDSSIYYPNSLISTSRYINQITFNSENRRALYPYDYQIQFEQGKGFYRFNLTGNYFFNYPKCGGLQTRFFAAKFGYLGSKDFANTYQYQPKLLGGNGSDDYTYSDYFLGRSAFSSYGDIPVENGGVAAQQIMIPNTGGLKFRLDPSSVQGQSDNWISAINLSTTLPNNLFPFKLPIKIFFDAGTYADAWQANSALSRFLYVGGLQLSLFKNLLNIYAPLVYSNDFKTYLNTDKEANKFIRKITFSIDIQNFHLSDYLDIPGL
ncbi:MAG TPA: M1 family metallopeptidase [Hanamia sp.]